MSAPADKPGIAWKVLTDAEMKQLLADGRFAGAPVDLADGYIHLSTQAQLAGTLDKHFAGQTDLWLAAVDLAALGPAIRWELSRGDQLFPHIYADLPMAAVRAHAPVERRADGGVVLPSLPTPVR